MTVLIMLFGVMIVVAGAILTSGPDILLNFLDSHKDEMWLYAAAIVVRIVLGLLLVSQAALSRYPLIIEILGGVSLAAALVIFLMGRRGLRRLIGWILSYGKPYSRFGGVVSVVFGAFLIYAYV